MRKRFRHWIYGLSAILALAFLFVHTQPVRTSVRHVLGPWLSSRSGGTVEIAELEYRLWRGEIELAGLRWESSSSRLTAREVKMSWRPFRGIEIQVIAPQFVAEQSDGAQPDPVSVPAFTSSLAKLEIHDGELQITNANDTPWLQVTSIDGEIAARNGKHVGHLQAVNGQAELPDRKELSFGPLQIDFEIGSQKLSITNARVEKAGSHLQAQGEMTSISPLTMDLDLDYRLDQGVTNELAAELNLTGTLEGQAHLTVDENGTDGAASFRSSQMSSPLFGSWSVEGALSLQGSEVEVSQLRFQGQGGAVSAHGRLDFERQYHTLEADLSSLDVAALSGVWVEDSVPIASFLDGQVHLTLEGSDIRTVRGNAQVTLSSRQAEGSMPLSGRLELTGGAEELVFRGDDLSIPFVQASFHGRARKDGPIDTTYDVQVEDLQGLEPLLEHLRLPALLDELTGTLSLQGRTQGSWRQPSTMSTSLSLDSSSFTLDGKSGQGRLDIRKQGRLVSFDEIVANIGQATTIATGTYHLDTQEVTAKLQAHRIRLSELALPALLEEWEAVATSIKAEVSGKFPALTGQVDIHLDDVELRETELPSLFVTARSDGRTAKMECRVEGSQVLASGAVDLEHPYSMESSVDLSALPLNPLLHGLFPSTPEDARLGVRGRLDLSLPLARVEEIAYRAQVDQLVGTYGGVEGGTDAAFVLVGDRDSLTVDELALVGTDTAIAIKGRVPLSANGTFDLELYGDAKLTLANQLLEEVELEGDASLDLHLAGSRDEPIPTGELRIDNGAVTWNGIRGSSLTAIVAAREGGIHLQELSGNLLGGTFRMSGEPPLALPSVERWARFNLEVEDVDLAELSTPMVGSPIQPLALVSANGTLEARGFELTEIRGSGNLVMLLTSLGDIIIENDAPTPWQFENNRLTLHGLHAVGGDTELDIDFTAQRKDETWMWRTSFKGAFDNVFLNPLIRTWDAALSGTTTLDLLIEGTDEVPTFSGTGHIEKARFVLREPPLVLNDLSGEVQFTDKTLRLVDITADAGGGTARSSGQVEIGSLHELAGLDLELAGNSIRLNYPDGMRSRLSGTLRLRGKPGVFLLSGDIRMDDALFDRDITLESELLSSVERQNLSYSEEVSFAETVMLDVRAQSANDIRIDNNLAQAQANVNLRMSGTLEAPELDGVIIARAEGTFKLGRNLYRIESGNIAFRGYPSTAAELDVSARTKVSGIEIIVRLNGPVDDITMELRAPDHSMLSQGDIASLLVTGRTLANVSDLQSVTGRERQIVGEQLASYLSGTLTNLVQRGLGDVLPFDTISVVPSTLETEVSPEIRFSIGKAITEDLSVTYSIGLDNVQSQLWIVDYRLPKKLALRATRKEDNEFAGRLSQQLEFDFPGRPARSDETIKRAKVAKVDILGGPEELEGQLSKKVRLRPGKAFDYWTSQEDVERLTRLLKEEGHLNASVESRWASTNDEVGSLTYRIETGAPIHIRWTGDDPGDAIRSDVLNRWDGRFPLNFLLPDLTAKITEALMQTRFFEAEVKATAEEGADGINEVVFDVRKGSEGRSITLDFEGNQALTDDDLRTALPPPSSRDFFELLQNPGRFEERLRLHYLSEGYVQARIGAPQVDFSRTTGDYRVTVPVDEGAITIVQEIAFDGVDYFDQAKLLHELKLRPGYPFRLKDYSEDRSTLTRIYRREGFTTTRVRGRLDTTESAFRVVYEVEEGAREKIGDIRFVGNHATKEGLIRRQLTFKENDPLRFSDFTETQQKLYELGVFRSVDMRTESKDASSPTSDVVVHLDETRDFRFGYGLRYSTEDRLEVLTGIRFPSLFGSAHRAGLTFTLNANESIFRGNYSMPYFWRYKLGTDFFLSRETDEDEFLSEETWSLTFQQHRELLKDVALQWSYTYRHNHILGKVTNDSPFPFDFTTRQSILTTSLIEDRRDNFIQPSSGRFASVTFQVAPEALGSQVKFVKLFGVLNTFFSLGRDLVWAASYRMGIADAFDEFLLPDNRFRAGGATTVRGFAQDSLGPADPITGTIIGGEGLVVFNQELRFPIFRWFGGVAFYDAGNVFLNASTFRPFDLRHSAGAGLRLVLPFGLLRFDYAWVLDRQPGEKASRFWFNFNHAF